MGGGGIVSSQLASLEIETALRVRAEADVRT